jgi:ABC-type uncharacterized transport system ATPase subunit
MPHAEELCDSVIMMHRGRKVLEERMDTIRRQYDPRRIHLEPLDPSADVSALSGLPEVECVGRLDEAYEIVLREGTDPAKVMSHIVQTVVPARLELSRPQLEDVFISLVTAGDRREDSRELRARITETPAEAAAL